MGRKKRKVSAGKRKINECHHDDLPAQSSDDKNAGEKGVSNKAITDDQSSQEKSSMDSFYEKLIKLHESSGLSIIFDFRATKVDLYLIYKEVTERGGSYQVSKDGKWIEVASALSIKNHASFLPSQIQKVYENLLCLFEQIHYYRSPAKASTLTGPGTPELKPTLQRALNEKTITRGPCAPPKAKTSYQLFLKMECEQLKKIYGERSGSLNLREMAIATWRKLSQNDRLPYIEASRKDKERFNREMAVYMQHKNKKVMKTENLLTGTTSTLINFGPSSPIHDDDYYVTLEADAGNFFLPDESLVESTIEMLKNARPNDPIFQINWDGCCGSPDSPN